MKPSAHQVLILHEEAEWRAYWQRALKEAGYHPAVGACLPDAPALTELARHDPVIMSLPLALAGLEQLLERPRPNLVVTLPLEGFGSSRQWQVYKLERVGAAVVDMPASEGALAEFIQQHLALLAS